MINRSLHFFQNLGVTKLAIVVGYILLFASIFYFPLLRDYFGPGQYLNVLAFAETFSPEAVARFEQKTGIRVNITYAETDEQVYAKFKINQGEGYDVVNVSDYMVHLLGQQNLLQSVDHEKLDNYSSLDKRFLDLIYDKGNQISVPHKWYVYGLAYDKEFFRIVPEDMSLKYIFTNPEVLVDQGEVLENYKVCMIDDGRDAVYLTALFLFGSINNLTQDMLTKIQLKLIEQKRWIEVYTVHSANYFLFSNITPIALMSSNYMRKILDTTDRFAFAIPQEGGILVVENMAIPKKSKKAAMAHQFLNFMISEEAAVINSSAYGYNSTNKVALQLAAALTAFDKNLFPDQELFKRLFIPLLPLQQRKMVEDVWLAVGFA